MEIFFSPISCCNLIVIVSLKLNHLVRYFTVGLSRFKVLVVVVDCFFEEFGIFNSQHHGSFSSNSQDVDYYM